VGPLPVITIFKHRHGRALKVSFSNTPVFYSCLKLRFLYDFGKRLDMGGSGSGRRWNSKETTSDYCQLDIRQWQREGLLEAFRSFVYLCWKVDVLPAPNLRAKPGRVILSTLDGASKQSAVWLEWTPCNYGGSRAWFLCPAPNCGQRVAILYGGAVACRHCRGLAYDSQQRSAKRQAVQAAAGIRIMLGGSGSLAEPFPPKPKGMHWRTYQRFYSRAERCESIFFGGIAALVERLEKLSTRLERRIT
jgi:hypothetical protein